MSSAGLKLRANRIPGERIETAVRTSSTTGITTTETQVDTVTAGLVDGRTYRITWDFPFDVSVATDHHFGRIRENTSAGAQLQGRRLSAVTTAQSYPGHMETEYTATATGNKTFVATLQRTGGSGNVNTRAASGNVAYLYVDYIRG
jgi:hypothetical protein